MHFILLEREKERERERKKIEREKERDRQRETHTPPYTHIHTHIEREREREREKERERERELMRFYCTKVLTTNGNRSICMIHVSCFILALSVGAAVLPDPKGRPWV